MKVNILLSTYNGEQYLKEQVKSIQDQTYQDWQLLIRDDGSTDGTVEIIQELVAQDERIRFINQGAIENLGVIKSFHALLKYEEADFYCFSDQDDVWLPEKIALQVAEATKHPQEEPLLVYTDLKVVDENLNVQHESMIRTQSDHANTELIQELTENTVTGGVAMINHALAELWTGQEKHALLMHDWYLALLAAAFGNSSILISQQNCTVSTVAMFWVLVPLENGSKTGFAPTFFLLNIGILSNPVKNGSKNLLDLSVSPQNKEIIENFVTIMDVTLKERMSRIRQYGYRKNRAFHTFVFTSLILTKFAYRGKK